MQCSVLLKTLITLFSLLCNLQRQTYMLLVALINLMAMYKMTIVLTKNNRSTTAL